MHKIEGSLGEHIDRAAARLCAEATKHGEAALTFNDVLLTAQAGSVASEVVGDFERQSKARHIAWINSKEGREHAARNEAEIAAAQERHDCLMRDLAELDFRSDVAVLDWLCAIQDSTDRMGVKIRRDDIITTFSRNGFEPNVNTGDDYRNDDRENSFRYLVGQALSTLKACAIHGILHQFVAEWKQRFNVASA